MIEINMLYPESYEAKSGNKETNITLVDKTGTKINILMSYESAVELNDVLEEALYHGDETHAALEEENRLLKEFLEKHDVDIDKILRG